MMRNAQMVSQKCALPAPVPCISRASVKELTGTKLTTCSPSSISAPSLHVSQTQCDICLESTGNFDPESTLHFNIS